MGLNEAIEKLDLNQNDQEESNRNNEATAVNLNIKEYSIDEFEEDERDADLEDFADKFKEIYEKNFIQLYLKSLSKDSPLNASTLPTKKYNKLTYEEEQDNESTTILFYFDSLECDETTGSINFVIVNTFDKTQKCYFYPHLCQNYGPYYKTQLYCTHYITGRTKKRNNKKNLDEQNDDSELFFLDLPIELYNLIDLD
jgi:hypothetical protein